MGMNALVRKVLAEAGVNEKRYTLWDVYPHADFITYPSLYEGFGNAFLEAVYYRKPIVVNDYSIYHKDIKPKGFQVIEIDGYVTEEAVQKASWVLNDRRMCRRMVDHNYQLGRRYFSYEVLHSQLKAFMMVNRMAEP